jgi:hypothetical protein
MGMFTEMLCDRTVNGMPLPDEFQLVAACNPYRLRKGIQVVRAPLLQKALNYKRFQHTHTHTHTHLWCILLHQLTLLFYRLSLWAWVVSCMRSTMMMAWATTSVPA